MRRGTIIFILFALVAAAIVGASQFLRSQPPMEFTVAVNPLAAEWVRAAVNAYNDTQPVVNTTQRIQFAVQVVDDLSVWQGNTNWTPENHPAAWIPASSVSIGYSERYTPVVASVARTPLVWGGYASRVEVVTRGGAEPFDWDAVQRVAAGESWSRAGGESNWGFVKLAFPRPDQSMSGLAVLFSGAASFHDSSDLAGGATRAPDFREWLTPVVESVPNFQTLGADPAAAMARGASTVDIALLPESFWLLNLNGLLNNEPIVFSYPAYQYMLDFPLAGWRNPLPTDPNAPIEQAAVQALATWLTGAARQSQLVTHGLRPATSEPTETASLFSAGDSYGIQLAPDFTQLVQPPSRSETQGLVQWFTQTALR